MKGLMLVLVVISLLLAQIDADFINGFVISLIVVIGLVDGIALGR